MTKSPQKILTMNMTWQPFPNSWDDGCRITRTRSKLHAFSTEKPNLSKTQNTNLSKKAALSKPRNTKLQELLGTVWIQQRVFIFTHAEHKNFTHSQQRTESFHSYPKLSRQLFLRLVIAGSDANGAGQQALSLTHPLTPAVPKHRPQATTIWKLALRKDTGRKKNEKKEKKKKKGWGKHRKVEEPNTITLGSSAKTQRHSIPQHRVQRQNNLDNSEHEIGCWRWRWRWWWRRRKEEKKKKRWR